MARFKDITALVLGLEINGLSVVRSLGRSRVQVIGMDSDLEQVTALSKYLLGRIKTDDIRGPSMIDSLIKLGEGGRKYAIIPTMEACVLNLSEARDRLPENLIYRLPDKEMTQKLLHKGSFRKLCAEHDLLSPAFAVVRNKTELEAALENFRFPLVMKGTLKKMGAAPKASFVKDRDQALAAYDVQAADRVQGGHDAKVADDSGEGDVSKDGGEMILEEWIPGGDNDVYFCLQSYGADSQLLASFMGRKIRQWPPRVGGTASAEPADLPEVEEMTTRFFKAVGFKGIGSMEYKFDARDKRYYAIEPTVGRTDFQSGIAPANRVNIPLAAFAEMAGEPVEMKKFPHRVKWVNPVADARSAEYYMDCGELTRAEWKKSLSGACVSSLFAIDDPGPWVSNLFRRVVNRLNRIFKK